MNRSVDQQTRCSTSRRTAAATALPRHWSSGFSALRHEQVAGVVVYMDVHRCAGRAAIAATRASWFRGRYFASSITDRAESSHRAPISRCCGYVRYGYAELALSRTDYGDRERKGFEEIREAGERAAKLIRQFLVFSRGQPAKLEVVDLSQILTNFEKMLGRMNLAGCRAACSTLPADRSRRSARGLRDSPR
jgi:hypothetical protein